MQNVLDWKIEIREKEGKGFQVQWKRWVVERTFAWLGNCRRLSKDYKKWPENHEGVVYVAMSSIDVAAIVRLIQNLFTDGF